jgi:BlaI family penicillinase repressor
LGRDRELPPPLEMMCLNALWEIQEGNVEDVRKVVSQSRPLAYTTVLTLLDRLARRGAVSRRKEGRGFRYQPTVARDKLRRMALRQFLEYHFEGSETKLKIFLEQPVENQDEQFVAMSAETPDETPEEVQASELADIALAQAVPELVE